MTMMNATVAGPSAPLDRRPFPARPAKPTEPMALAQQLDLAYRFVAQHVVSLPEPYACCLLFFTITAEQLPVTSFSVRRMTVHAAWREGATRVRQWAWAHCAASVELRVDWACAIEPASDANLAPRRSDPACTWAEADDELERTELLTTLGKRTALNLCAVQHLSEPAPTTPHARWQLLLEGLYMDSTGELTALPRPRMAPQHLRSGPAAPMLYRAAQALIVQRQDDDGSWGEASTLLDHLGITYALLLAHNHTRLEQRAGASAAQACHRAVAYLIEQMRRWSLHDYASELLHALSLIVLVRYTTQFPGAAASPTVHGLMALLAQQVAAQAPATSADAPPWAQLALEAQRQRKPSCAPEPLIDTCASRRNYEGKWLHACWPQLRQIADDAGRPSTLTDPWIAAAVMECALRPGQPQFSSAAQQAQFAANMQGLFRACYQRIVWPEVALFQARDARKQAAFFSPRAGNSLVCDCRVASQLLITLCASIHFSAAPRQTGAADNP